MENEVKNQQAHSEAITETWIPGHENRYSISSSGVVYSHTKKGRMAIATQFRTFRQRPEKYVQLFKSGIRETVSIRKCMAEAFLGSRRNDLTHWIDGNPSNTILSNLGLKKRRAPKAAGAYKILVKIFGLELGSQILERYVSGKELTKWLNKELGNRSKPDQKMDQGTGQEIGQDPDQTFIPTSDQRWVPGFEGSYICDNKGRVYKIGNDGNRNQFPEVTSGQVWGKPKVKLYSPITKYHYSKPLSLIIAASFLNAKQGDKIGHYDGDIYNCSPANLYVNNAKDVIQEKLKSSNNLTSMKIKFKQGSIVDKQTNQVIATKNQIDTLIYLGRKYPGRIDTISRALAIDVQVANNLLVGILSQTPDPDPMTDPSFNKFLARILDTIANDETNQTDK